MKGVLGGFVILIATMVLLVALSQFSEVKQEEALVSDYGTVQQTALNIYDEIESFARSAAAGDVLPVVVFNNSVFDDDGQLIDTSTSIDEDVSNVYTQGDLCDGDNEILKLTEGVAICCGQCADDVRMDFPSDVMCSRGKNHWVPCSSFSRGSLDRVALKCEDPKSEVELINDNDELLVTANADAQWGEYLVYDIDTTVSVGSYDLLHSCGAVETHEVRVRQPSFGGGGGGGGSSSNKKDNDDGNSGGDNGDSGNTNDNLYLTLVRPLSTNYFDTETIALEYETNGDSCKYFLNNQSYNLSSCQNSSLNLAIGNYSLSVEATKDDETINESVLFRVLKDNSLFLSWYTPADGQNYTGDVLLNFSTNAQNCSYVLEGVEYSNTCAPETLSLDPGLYNITLLADIINRSRTFTVLDNFTPYMTLLEPLPTAYLSTDTISISVDTNLEQCAYDVGTDRTSLATCNSNDLTFGAGNYTMIVYAFNDDYELNESVSFEVKIPPTELFCGDNITSGDEVCDGGTRETYLLGYLGVEECNDSCDGWQNWVASEFCGDDTVQTLAGEECDTNVPLQCVTADGYQGTKTCTSCLLSTCTSTEFCGDDEQNGEEVCELGQSVPCTVGGYDGWQFCDSCTSFGTCQVTERCGDGIENGPEECDSGNLLGVDGCSLTCERETITALASASPTLITQFESILFDAADSVGKSLTYEWDFEGDGTYDAVGEQISFAYVEPGTYMAMLRISNAYASDTYGIEVIVLPRIPDIPPPQGFSDVGAPAPPIEPTPFFSTEPGDIFWPVPGSTLSSVENTFYWGEFDGNYSYATFDVNSCKLVPGDMFACLGSTSYAAAPSLDGNSQTLDIPLLGQTVHVNLVVNLVGSQNVTYHHAEYTMENVSGCGNGLLEPELNEICEVQYKGDACITQDGYDGNVACNAQCDGYNVCKTDQFCGDGRINKPEACDDGNNQNGDGCSSTCEYEFDTDFFYSDFDLTDNTLVVYNKNAVGSQELAEYYADARSIPSSQLCGVNAPNGNIITGEHFLGMRNQVLSCICSTIDVAQRPPDCSYDYVDVIAQASNITHISIMRGIPPRMTMTGMTADNEEPMTDYFLTRTLYLYEPYLGALTGRLGYLKTPYEGGYNSKADVQPSNTQVAQVRSIVPWFDKQVAYGRIEASTVERTKELIDRTIAAENLGYVGNAAWSTREFFAVDETMPIFDQNNLATFSSYLFNQRTSICKNYQAGWDPTCRWAYNPTGHVPGEYYSGGELSTIPRPVNIGIYVGSDPFADDRDGGNNAAHRAFDGFTTMLRWFKSDTNCVELCEDMPTQSEIDSCKASSMDFFREINTACIGASPNLFGYQSRSWPVQYFGFQPGGWTALSGGNGAYERTPPQFIEEGGYQDDRFTDSKFIRIGQKDVLGTTCYTEAGVEEECLEFATTQLRRVVRTDDPLIGMVNFTATLRYRNPADSGKIYVQVRPYVNGSYASLGKELISLAEVNADWHTNTMKFSMNYGSTPVDLLLFEITSPISNGAHKYFDLDGVEFINDNTAEHLIPDTVGSFAHHQKQTVAGDWASNVIDRMGGIAWWGSGNHHITGGVSLFDTGSHGVPALFSGRTLGESALLSRGNPISSIVYGDPLYQPSAVKIFHPTYTEVLGDRFNPFEVTVGQDVPLRLNAWHGKANMNTVRWELSVCGGHSVENCTAWVPWQDGNSALQEFPMTFSVDSVADTLGDDFMLRLRVWNEWQEEHDLYNFAYFRRI